jgi:hypothetical protein
MNLFWIPTIIVPGRDRSTDGRALGTQCLRGNHRAVPGGRLANRGFPNPRIFRWACFSLRGGLDPHARVEHCFPTGRSFPLVLYPDPRNRSAGHPLCPLLPVRYGSGRSILCLSAAVHGIHAGVVLANNLLLLWFFWELTSISSFLLIGYWHHRDDARKGARMALTITGAGGLALLGGFILIGQTVGSYNIDQCAFKR